MKQRYCPTFQQIINKYNNDHLDNWDSVSQPSQDKYIEQNKEWSEVSNVEVDEPDNMSGGRNTPMQSTSQLPATSLAPTLDDLTQVVMDLGVAVGHTVSPLS